MTKRDARSTVSEDETLVGFSHKRQNNRTTACQTCALPEDILAEVDAAGPEIWHTSISEYLRVKHNVEISEDAIRRHRKRHVSR